MEEEEEGRKGLLAAPELHAKGCRKEEEEGEKSRILHQEEEEGSQSTSEVVGFANAFSAPLRPPLFSIFRKGFARLLAMPKKQIVLLSAEEEK